MRRIKYAILVMLVGMSFYDGSISPTTTRVLNEVVTAINLNKYE